VISGDSNHWSGPHRAEIIRGPGFDGSLRGAGVREEARALGRRGTPRNHILAGTISPSSARSRLLIGHTVLTIGGGPSTWERPALGVPFGWREEPGRVTTWGTILERGNAFQAHRHHLRLCLVGASSRKAFQWIRPGGDIVGCFFLVRHRRSRTRSTRWLEERAQNRSVRGRCGCGHAGGGRGKGGLLTPNLSLARRCAGGGGGGGHAGTVGSDLAATARPVVHAAAGGVSFGPGRRLSASGLGSAKSGAAKNTNRARADGVLLAADRGRLVGGFEGGVNGEPTSPGGAAGGLVCAGPHRWKGTSPMVFQGAAMNSTSTRFERRSAGRSPSRWLFTGPIAAPARPPANGPGGMLEEVGIPRLGRRKTYPATEFLRGMRHSAPFPSPWPWAWPARRSAGGRGEKPRLGDVQGCRGPDFTRVLTGAVGAGTSGPLALVWSPTKQ